MRNGMRFVRESIGIAWRVRTVAGPPLIAAALSGALVTMPATATATTRNITVQDVVVEEGEDVVFKFKPSSTGVYFRYKYKTEDDSAKGGTDYSSRSGHLVFPHTATEVTLTVTTLDDNDLCENDETFTVKLTDPESLFSTGSGAAWVNDYRFPPSIKATATIKGWGLSNAGNYSTQHLGCGGGFGE